MSEPVKLATSISPIVIDTAVLGCCAILADLVHFSAISLLPWYPKSNLSGMLFYVIPPALLVAVPVRAYFGSRRLLMVVLGLLFATVGTVIALFLAANGAYLLGEIFASWQRSGTQ